MGKNNNKPKKGGSGGGGGGAPKQQQQQQKGNNNSTQKGASKGVKSICQRPFDLLLVFWFIVFFCSTLLTDLHNFTASYLNIDVNELEQMDIPWLPKFANWVYFRWGRTVDPVLLHNPMYWQAMEWVNILFLTPVAMLAVPALINGWKGFRNVLMVAASFTFYSLIICLATCVLGDDASKNPDGTVMVTPDPSMFIGIYIPYLTLSLAVIIRMWPSSPFTESGIPRGCHAFTLWSIALTSLGVFILYIFKWVCLHELSVLPPVIVENVVPYILRLP